MVLSLLFLLTSILGYLAKCALLFHLWICGEPHLRILFLVLLAVHIAVNLFGAHGHCRAASQNERRVALPVMLVFGAITPLMQIVHVLDMLAGQVAGCWTGHRLGKRPLVSPAPLGLVLEELVFVIVSFYLRTSLSMGRLKTAEKAPTLPLALDALLTVIMSSSLVSAATGLVLWDSSMSIKLSREMFGAPGRPYGGRMKGGCLLLAHLSFRCIEVAGKSALLIIFGELWGPKPTAAYLVFTYIIHLSLLLLVSIRDMSAFRVCEASVLAWPLIFANLAQFVDCPKHSSSAKSLSGLVCCMRALELAVAFSMAIAAVLLETELCGMSEWKGGLSAEAVEALGFLRELYCLTANPVCGVFFLVHYLCIAGRWMVCANSHSGWLEGEEAFWPASSSLTPLLLRTGCERPPVTCNIIAAVPAALCGCLWNRHSAQARLRMEDFEILRLIGCGEFGKVYQVRQHSTQQSYAMKKLSKDFYAQRRMTDKAIREISTLSLARDSPFVVRLIYTIENSREWAMVMEYCPGGDLQQLLLAEGFPGLALDRTLWISAEVALALEYLHCKGIVFRDLKLENVVLDKDGHAKLTDFGLAKQRRGGQDAVAEAELGGSVYQSFARTFCGSYGYAAPEVNPKRQVHGYAADLYSFGVLILMMLMGGEVYRDRREPQAERRLPPERPQELQDVISSLSFGFYWASHHLLQPVKAAHRVEVNMDGETVVVQLHPRGVRRQARPHRPPNSPRELDVEAPAASSTSPSRFPNLACTDSGAMEHRWNLALDLVRVLTNEFPEQRGTVATIKRHAFFAEEIQDWRAVYPRSWLVDNLRDRLLNQEVHGAAIEQRVTQWLENMPSHELTLLQEDPDLTVERLQQRVGPSASTRTTNREVDDFPMHYHELLPPIDPSSGELHHALPGH